MSDTYDPTPLGPEPDPLHPEVPEDEEARNELTDGQEADPAAEDPSTHRGQ